MIHLKSSSHQGELRKSIKKLIADLDQTSKDRKDNIAESLESVASYVARLNEDALNRSFLDYCSAARNYANIRSND